MSRYLVGSRIEFTFTVKDKSGVVVDPGSLVIRLRGPVALSFPTATYTWNGVTWTSSEGVVGQPSKAATGIFVFVLSLPWDNNAKGDWTLAGYSTSNVLGLGHGSFDTKIVGLPTPVLNP